MIRITTLTVTVATLALGLALTARADNKTRTVDEVFVINVSSGSSLEIKLGNLAAQRAVRPDVKEFARKMVADHTKAGQQLHSLLNQKGVAVPAEMSKKDTATYERLAALKAEDFDAGYIRAMIDDHKNDIAEFEKEIKNGEDAEVKAWATKTLPTLREHLTLIQNIHDKNADTKTIGK